METTTETLTKALIEAIKQRKQLDADIRTVVAGLRSRNVPWSEISLYLGITRQAAQQRYGKADTAPARDTSRDHLYTPAENAAADAALATMHAIARATDNHAQHVDATATFLDGTAPAKPPITRGKARNPMGQTVDYATDKRPSFTLNSAGKIDGVAQPGTGKGPHACPRCSCTNHKGTDDQVRAYFDCTPTKYDPQDIADYLNSTGLRHKEQ